MAPEPAPADPSAVVDTPKRRPPGTTRARPGLAVSRLARLVPLAVFALVVLGGRSGFGRYASWAIVALVVSLVVFRTIARSKK